MALDSRDATGIPGPGEDRVSVATAFTIALADGELGPDEPCGDQPELCVRWGRVVGHRPLRAASKLAI